MRTIHWHGRRLMCGLWGIGLGAAFPLAGCESWSDIAYRSSCRSATEIPPAEQAHPN